MKRLGSTIRSLPAAAGALFLAALALASFPAPASCDGAAAPIETGVASWYGPEFHGRRTSNGEIYDKEKLTCAHRTLPFGSYLLVRDLDTDASVVVRVNDRGPFAKDRIIDLSEAAARIIGMIPTGTARVSLTLIPKEEALAWKGSPLDGSAGEIASGSASGAASGSASSPGPDASGAAARADPVGNAVPAPSGSRVRIQVASYASETNARSTVDRLAASGMAASIERSGGHFRVVFPDLSPDEARLTATRLEGLGYRGLEITTTTPLPR